jgi:hypothetical protein
MFLVDQDGYQYRKMKPHNPDKYRDFGRSLFPYLKKFRKFHISNSVFYFPFRPSPDVDDDVMIVINSGNGCKKGEN